MTKTTNFAPHRLFVIAAQKAYGSGDITLVKDADGRKTLTIENDSFKLTDEFDGGNPFCGIERLIDKATNHVIWNGYYHGWLTKEVDIAAVFDFLRAALQNPDNQTILRGPAEYKAGNFKYMNTLDYGDFNCFYGSEAIYDSQNVQVYYGRYGGGLVDIAEDTGEA